MCKWVFLLIFSIAGFLLHAKSVDIPRETRDVYASSMYNAFVLQSQGKSTLAFYQFDTAREQAKKAGENPLKLAAIEQLFGWYRKYGSALNLFYTLPTGTDRIIGEYKPYSCHSMKFHSSPSYQSEWGKTPDQAAKMRDFMVGVAETISGVFLAAVHPGAGTAIAVGLWMDGFGRMYTSLNYLWAGHEALLYLHNCETTTAKAMNGK